MKKYILSVLALCILATALPAQAGGIVCADFRSQAEAQRYFDTKQPGYKRLDRYKDGITCEALR